MCQKMVGNKVTNNKHLLIFLISQGIAVSQKEDKHIDVLYSILNVEWGVTTKTQSFLRSLTARGDLRAGATKYLK